jgi:hypothetical protein
MLAFLAINVFLGGAGGGRSGRRRTGELKVEADGFCPVLDLIVLRVKGGRALELAVGGVTGWTARQEVLFPRVLADLRMAMTALSRTCLSIRHPLLAYRPAMRETDEKLLFTWSSSVNCSMALSFPLW